MGAVKKLLLIALVTILVNMLFCTCLIAQSLVAYWSFEEVDEDVLIDHSGNGNDGTINGDPEWVDGPCGKAMEFDGADDYIRVPNSESYNFANEDPFSISLWINYEAKGDYAGVMQKFNGGYPFKVEVDTGNVLYCSIYDGTNNPRANIGNVNGEWHHCVFMKDADNVYSYLDGVLKATAANTITGQTSNTVDLYIGARRLGNLMYLGMLDEIAIYNRFLTEDEIVEAGNCKLPEVVGVAVEHADKLTTAWGCLKRYR
jgi:hypothetical protein